MPSRLKRTVAPADTVYAFTTPTRSRHSSMASASTSSTEGSSAVHQVPQIQTCPYPRHGSNEQQEPLGLDDPYPQDSSDEHQEPLGQSSPYPLQAPAFIDGSFDDNQQMALAAARRFLILGHLLKTVCRRVSYGERSGFGRESIYGGPLEEAMLSAHEKSELMDTSEMMLSAMEQLGQWPLIVEHDKRADDAGRPGLAERAEEDSKHICKFIANVLFEDGQLET